MRTNQPLLRPSRRSHAPEGRSPACDVACRGIDESASRRMFGRYAFNQRATARDCSTL